MIAKTFMMNVRFILKVCLGQMIAPENRDVVWPMGVLSHMLMMLSSYPALQVGFNA